MIKTLADLLEGIKKAEAGKIDALQIKHRPTIGNTYEGLTSRLLESVLFDGLDLNIVCNSFIKLEDGSRSDEYDIMIIEGEGEKILYSKEQYDVKFEQVIAVIQVKKKINKQNLEGAYLNLKNVYDILDLKSAPNYTLDLFRDAYVSICNEDVIDKHGMFRRTFSSSTCEQIFHMLRLESILPARIVFGYEGYASEFSFREGFVEFLSDNKSEIEEPKHGFAPVNFPDLIINGDLTLIKANGMPYVGSMMGHQWPFYLSDSHNAISKLIEILWTRLSHRFNISSDIFGDDLEVEGANLFLLGNLVNIGGLRAWNFEYTPLTKKQLEGVRVSEEWQPIILNKEQHHIIAHLGKFGRLRIDQINVCLSQMGIVINETDFVSSIIQTKLVGIDGHEIILLTTHCECIVMPDGNIYAADNKTDKLTRWADKKLQEIKDVKS